MYEYQEHLLGSKGGWGVGPTTLPPSCADCLEIWKPQPSWTLRTCPGLCRYSCSFSYNVISVSALYKELASWCHLVAVIGMNSRINTDDRRWHDLSACFITTSHVRTRVRDRTWLTFTASKWLFRLAATKHAIPRCNAALFISVHIRRNEHLFTSKPGSFWPSGPDQRKWGHVQRSSEVENWEVIHTNLCA